MSTSLRSIVANWFYTGKSGSGNGLELLIADLSPVEQERDAALARVAELEQALDGVNVSEGAMVKRLQRDNKALRHLVRDLHAGWMTGGPDLSWHEWSEIRAASKGRVAELLGEVQQ